MSEETAGERTIAAGPGDARIPSFFLVASGPFETQLFYLRRSLVAAYRNNCFSIAKGAAYSFLISLFPVLTVLTALLVSARAESVVQILSNFFGQVVPPGTQDLVLSQLRAQGSHVKSISVAVALLGLWTGSGAILSLMEGFQAAYRLPSGRPFFQQRGMAMLLVIITALPAVSMSALILSGNRIEAELLRWGEPEAISLPVQLGWRAVRYLLAFISTTLSTGLLYYFGIDDHALDPAYGRRQHRFWRVWPGAIWATAMWLIATAAFSWYVHHLANYNFFYGSIGAFVLLAVWLYLLACIALLGCEYNAERDRVLAGETELLKSASD